MNLTDVDDKTIRDSQATGKSLEELTTFFASEFKKDSALLNIIPPAQYTRAVEHIPQMVSLIETLIEKGFAYSSDDGSVYFNVRKDTKYGQLSKIALSEKLENAGGRIVKDEYEKENASDFALWKAWDENDGDVFWETSLGKGRPGWHIECSAMSMQYLGNHFDVHTGGVDLIFPHHENEIAQSECAAGEQFVNYWLHNEWVMVEGKKMAKSAGNFVTLQTIIEKDISPLAFRLLLLMSHYRSPVNFTWEALNGAENALKRLQTHFLEFDAGGSINQKYKELFTRHIENDLNTPLAIATLWDMIKDPTIPSVDKRATLVDFDTVLGLGLSTLKQDIIPSEILALVELREEARKEKDWDRSDEIRLELEGIGYIIKDTDNGPLVEKK
jgi:cysteinyl-tRNA synthetase